MACIGDRRGLLVTRRVLRVGSRALSFVEYRDVTPRSGRVLFIFSGGGIPEEGRVLVFYVSETLGERKKQYAHARHRHFSKPSTDNVAGCYLVYVVQPALSLSLARCRFRPE